MLSKEMYEHMKEEFNSYPPTLQKRIPKTVARTMFQSLQNYGILICASEHSKSNKCHRLKNGHSICQGCNAYP